MSAASIKQLQEQVRELRELRRDRVALTKLREQLGRVQQICLDHATCDCSAAMMILDVIGEK